MFEAWKADDFWTNDSEISSPIASNGKRKTKENNIANCTDPFAILLLIVRPKELKPEIKERHCKITAKSR